MTGTLTMILPVGPRVNGRVQLAARPGEELVYDLSVTTSVDRTNYQLKGEIFTGPSQFGVVVKVTEMLVVKSRETRMERLYIVLLTTTLYLSA